MMNKINKNCCNILKRSLQIKGLIKRFIQDFMFFFKDNFNYKSNNKMEIK